MRRFVLLMPLGLTGCLLAPFPEADDTDVVIRRDYGDPLPAAEAVKLLKAGVSPALVRELVDRRGAAPLSADDIIALKQVGADDALVTAMMAAERREPPPRTETVVLHEYVDWPHSSWTVYPSWSLWWGGSWSYHHHQHGFRRSGGTGSRVRW